MKTIKKNWKLFLTSLCFLIPSFLIAAFAVFYAVLYLFPKYGQFDNNSPIQVLLLIKGHNFIEIRESPIPYLCSISLVSALVAAFWNAFILPGSNHKLVQILFAPWVSVLFTGPVWGLIWSMNRWPAESFQTFDDLMYFRNYDIGTGLSFSCLSAAQSFPLNIISFAAFCGLLYASTRLFTRDRHVG